MIGIHHKSFNIMIFIGKLFFSQIFMLNMGEPILGYLNSHDRQRVVPDRAFHARLHGNPGLRDQEQLAPG